MTYTAKLEVPFEMLDYGCASAMAGPVTFTRTKIKLNKGDFDGNPQFYFETVAAAPNTGNNGTVTLHDVTNNVDRASFEYTGGTSAYTRRRSSAMSLASGDVEYVIVISQTTGDNDLRVTNGRIIVAQDSTATKTVISFPLTIANSGVYTNTDGTSSSLDSTLSTSYSQTNAARYLRFVKTAANWPTTGISCALDAIIRLDNSGGTSYIGLYDIDSSSLVTGAECTHTGDTNIYHVRQTFNWSDMTTGHGFEAKIKSSSASYTARVYRSCLLIYLTNLEKGEVYLRVGSQYSSSAALSHTRHAGLYTSTNYSNPVCYFQSTGLCANSHTDASALGQRNGNSGTGSDVSGSDIDWNSATKAYRRTSSISPTSGYDVYAHHNATTTPTTDVQDEAGGMLVIAFSGTSSSTSITVTPGKLTASAAANVPLVFVAGTKIIAVADAVTASASAKAPAVFEGDVDVKYVCVERSIGGSANYVQISRKPYSTDYFDDSYDFIHGTQYWYRVREVTNGVVTPYSPEVCLDYTESESCMAFPDIYEVSATAMIPVIIACGFKTVDVASPMSAESMSHYPFIPSGSIVVAGQVMSASAYSKAADIISSGFHIHAIELVNGYIRVWWDLSSTSPSNTVSVDAMLVTANSNVPIVITGSGGKTSKTITPSSLTATAQLQVPEVITVLTPNHWVDPDATGSATGHSEANAFTTLAQVNAHTFVAGDVIAFKRGKVWYGNLSLGQSGTSSNWINVTAYGSGALPKISNLTQIVGKTWSSEGSGVWACTNHGYTSNPERMLLGGVEYDPPASGGVTSTNRWRFYTTGTILRVWTGSDTSNPETFYAAGGGVVASKSATGSGNAITVVGKSYHRYSYLDLEGGSYSFSVNTSGSTPSNYVRVDHCTIGAYASGCIQVTGATDSVSNTYVYINDNYIDGKVLPSSLIYSQYPFEYDGIYIKALDYGWIYNNQIYNNSHSAIILDAQTGKSGCNTCRYIKVYNNDISGAIGGVTFSPTWNRGFATQGIPVGRCSYNEIYNNVFRDFTVQSQMGGDNNNFHDNEIYNIRISPQNRGSGETRETAVGVQLSNYTCCQSNTIYHNTFHDIDCAAIGLPDGTYQSAYDAMVINNVIDSNIIYDCGQDARSSLLDGVAMLIGTTNPSSLAQTMGHNHFVNNNITAPITNCIYYRDHNPIYFTSNISVSDWQAHNGVSFTFAALPNGPGTGTDSDLITGNTFTLG